MADIGRTFRAFADHPQLRWLGPHKGVVHLALASIVNACFDLWEKARGLPLWKLLLDLTPEQIVALLDLSYLEEVLTAEDALALLRDARPTRNQRETVLRDGYPGYVLFHVFGKRPAPEFEVWLRTIGLIDGDGALASRTLPASFTALLEHA